jgi:hypothetical protein
MKARCREGKVLLCDFGEIREAHKEGLLQSSLLEDTKKGEESLTILFCEYSRSAPFFFLRFFCQILQICSKIADLLSILPNIADLLFFLQNIADLLRRPYPHPQEKCRRRSSPPRRSPRRSSPPEKVSAPFLSPPPFVLIPKIPVLYGIVGFYNKRRSIINLILI